MSAHARPADVSSTLDFEIECWAQRVIARSILYLDGELTKQAAVDGSWFAAVDAGLVDEFGVDEIQAAMALAFGTVRC